MLKKVLALALAGAMVIGSMSMSAFADTTNADVDTAMTADTTITISGLTKGDKVHIYKVVGWVGSDSANNWGGWQVNGGFTDVIADSLALGNIIDSAKSSGYTGITSEIAGDLSRSAGKTGTEITGSPFETGKDGQEDTSITVEGVELGMYMAIIEPADANTVYNPVFVSADWFEGNTNSFTIQPSESSYSTTAVGAAKKSELIVTKESTNANDTELAGGEASDPGDTVKPGDELTFTVDTTIPGYGETFKQPTFILKDTMDKLIYQKNIRITSDDGDLSAPDNYTVTTSNDNGYVITFNPTWLKTLDTPLNITATYTAKVKDLGAYNYDNINKGQNTVEIVYSHDPSTETTPGNDRKEYKKDITNHYTFAIDANNIGGAPDLIGESGSEIIKIAVDREGNPLYSTKEIENKITETPAVKSPLAGCTFKLTCPDGTTKTVVSDDNGRLLFEGLDEGTYTLEETAAPSGFVRDTQPHTIVIDAKLAPKHYTEWYDQRGNWYDNAGEPADDRTKFEYDADELVSYTITFDGAEIAKHTFDHEPAGSSQIKWSRAESKELPASIRNTQGVELPSTGGIGTTIFYAGGAVLVLLAGVLLVSKRRFA